MPDPSLSTAAVPVDASAVERPYWYKDAVIYQLHVKAFFDSNDDGIGDFDGLKQKLDYVKDLGVNTIWLLPFYPSPLQATTATTSPTTATSTPTTGRVPTSASSSARHIVASCV